MNDEQRWPDFKFYAPGMRPVSRQCTAVASTTGQRCRMRTADASGRCTLHRLSTAVGPTPGGSSDWYMYAGQIYRLVDKVASNGAPYQRVEFVDGTHVNAWDWRYHDDAVGDHVWIVMEMARGKYPTMVEQIDYVRPEEEQ